MEHLREAYEQMTDVCGARLSRRSFVKAGGALVVGFGVFRGRSAKAAALINGDAFDVSLPASWIVIRPDNTVLFRTARS
jgi:nicotinate dehydrogenase subunit B